MEFRVLSPNAFIYANVIPSAATGVTCERSGQPYLKPKFRLAGAERPTESYYRNWIGTENLEKMQMRSVVVERGHKIQCESF